MTNTTAPRLSESDLARRRAAEQQLSDDLDGVEAAEAAVRAAEATRTRALIRTIDNVETRIVPVIGLDFAYRSMTAEIAVALHISERAADMLVSTARVARALTASVDSLATGRISYRHLVALADQAATLPIEVVAAFEAQALPYAETHSVPATTRQARVLRERMHPETIAERTVTAMSERRVWLTALPDGMVEIGALLPAIEGEAVMNRITRISTALRTTGGETRTLGQITADVFADLLLGEDAENVGTEDRAQATTRISRRIVPEVSVTVPLLSMMQHSQDPAELIGYGPFDPQVARALADRAPHLTRLITDPFTGQPIARDPRKYRPDRRLRRWVRERDRHCRFPGCHRRIEATDIDHTIPRSAGGCTEPGNLAALCRHHHRLKDTAGWSVVQTGNGVLTWTSPAGRTAVTEPDRNVLDGGLEIVREFGIWQNSDLSVRPRRE